MRYLTTEEARRRLGLTTRKTIATAIRQRRLRGIRKGRVWLVREDDVQKYVPSRRHQHNALQRGRGERARLRIDRRINGPWV